MYIGESIFEAIPITFEFLPGYVDNNLVFITHTYPDVTITSLTPGQTLTFVQFFLNREWLTVDWKLYWYRSIGRCDRVLYVSPTSTLTENVVWLFLLSLSRIPRYLPLELF